MRKHLVLASIAGICLTGIVACQQSSNNNPTPQSGVPATSAENTPDNSLNNQYNPEVTADNSMSGTTSGAPAAMSGAPMSGAPAGGSSMSGAPMSGAPSDMNNNPAPSTTAPAPAAPAPAAPASGVPATQ